MKIHLSRQMLVAAAIAGLAGCGGATTTPASPAPQAGQTQSQVAPAQPAATPIVQPSVLPQQPTATQSAQLPLDEPMQVIRRSFQDSVKKAYAMEVTIEDKDGKEVIRGKFVPPGNLHIQTTSDTDKTEMIIYGEKLWITTDGKTKEIPNAKVQIAKMLEQYSKDPESLGMKFSDAKFVSIEVINGTPAWVYTYVTTMDSVKLRSNSKLWISIASKLPIRQESETEAFGTQNKTVQVMTYDPTLKVEPPLSK